MNKEGMNETHSLKLCLLKVFILNSQAYVKLIAQERPVRKKLNNLGMRWYDLEYSSGRKIGKVRKRRAFSWKSIMGIRKWLETEQRIKARVLKVLIPGVSWGINAHSGAKLRRKVEE